MKRILLFTFILIGSLVLFACNKTTTTTSQTTTTTTSTTTTTTTTTQTTTTTKKSYMEDAHMVISSLDYKNTGKMGDTDGPAFAVYSKNGYNGASVDLNIKDVEIRTRFKGELRYINAYAFLGIDVTRNGYWSNCIDTGLVWSGSTGGWHIFYNIYQTLNPDTPSWYESNKILPKNDEYTLTLTITEDNYALLVVEGKNNGFRDQVTIEVKGAKKDGSTTGFLFNVALDYPENTKVDSEGNPSNNWKTITLANTDKNLYFKNLLAYNLTLFSGEEERIPWTRDKNSAVSIWPDITLGFDYAPTTVGIFDGTKYCIDLDMNRK